MARIALSGRLWSGKFKDSAIVFQVAVTSLQGSLFYAAFRATGTLWVPIAIHALTDFSLYVVSGPTAPAQGHANFEPSPIAVVMELVLAVLSIIFVISAALQDRRTRREQRTGTQQPSDNPPLRTDRKRGH